MGRRLVHEEVLAMFREVHGDKYDYSKVIYNNKRIKVKIVCPDHGMFMMTPNNHAYQKQGCKKCWDERRSDTRTFTTEKFIEKAVDKHGELYDYSNVVYTGCRDKVAIICKTHGEFRQIPCDHLQGRGCWQCKDSKGEKLVAEILERNKIGYEKQYSFDDLRSERGRVLRFDFCLDNGTLIEYDGQQHFEESSGYYNGKLENIQKRDNIKNEYCKRNGLTLLRIPYTMNSVEIEKQIMKLT